MKRRLYITALLTSPVMALYGVAPFYIFERLTLLDGAKIAAGLTMHTVTLWLLHIACLRRAPGMHYGVQFGLTYVGSAIIQCLLLWLGVLAGEPRPPVQQYMAYPLLTSLAVNAIVQIIATSIVASQQRMAAEREVRDLRIQAGEAQMQVLTQQLQPHFLFNALSVLKSLIDEDGEAAKDYSVRLSNFLRYAAGASKRDVVTLREEIKFTTDYLALQRVRFDGSFHCAMDIPAASLDARIPPYALQTLVENAFKHNHFTEKSPLEIRITGSGESLTVYSDAAAANPPTTGGTGLENLDRRYRLIIGAGIVITRSGTEFCVTLPLIIS